jgi:hypothetical protein
MTCPEIINPNRPQRHVVLSRYSLLHPEGRQLISVWFQRAWRERNCQQDEAFEPFIFAWFAFNGWAACVTDTDRDRDIIDALAADRTINADFIQAIQNNQSVSVSVGIFSELLPIFDVKSLRRRRILRNDRENRSKRVSYYLSQGADQFEPRCWQRHHDAGEAMPINWGHILNAIYKVRCNLFHGLKAAHSEMDQIIVHSAYLALVSFLAETGYLNA